MDDLKTTIMRRDDISSEEADDQIAEAKAQLMEYLEEGDSCSAQDICEEFFGLEPDYLFDLI